MIRDPSSGVDRVTSVILDFGSGHAVGTCSTQQVPYQRVQILGTTGRVEIEIPFNAPPDRPCRIFVSDGSDPVGVHAATEEFAVCDQYTIEVDRFAEAVRGPHALAMPLEESVLNLRVMDAITRAAGE